MLSKGTLLGLLMAGVPAIAIIFFLLTRPRKASEQEIREMVMWEQRVEQLESQLKLHRTAANVAFQRSETMRKLYELMLKSRPTTAQHQENEARKIVGLTAIDSTLFRPVP